MRGGQHRAPSRAPRRAPRGQAGLATKLLASTALVAAAAGVAGLGTFGAFTSTTSASQVAATGTVSIGLTSEGPAATSVPVAGLVPGDQADRAVTLTRAAGSERFGSVTLTTTASGSALLTGAGGLQLRVDQCPVAWTRAADGSLACSAQPTAVVADRAVLGRVTLDPSTAALNGEARAAHLRLRLTLPANVGNELQGQSGTLTHTFDATQRAAGFR